MNIDDIIQNVPVDQIAAQLGIDPDQARKAISLGVPAIIGGMQENAKDPAGEQSLAQAIGQHNSTLADGVLDGDESIDRVDTTDGEKIVGHVFGGNEDQVMHQLGGASGTDGGLMKKLLPILAPIVMSYLAKRLMGKGGSGDSPSGGMGDILGQIIGGSGRQGGSHGGGLADVLGQVLGGGGGGGAKQGGGGLDISDILGGLLGGGRR